MTNKSRILHLTISLAKMDYFLNISNCDFKSIKHREV